jgi:hypothetical protein
MPPARASRAQRLGEILSDRIPDTADEKVFDLILKSVEHSTIPEAFDDIVFAVIGADDGDDF